MKKAIALTLSACMTASLLAGCGAASSSASSAASSDAASASTESAAPAGDVSLSVSWWGGDSRHEATQKALDTYAAANGVSITTNYNAWSGWEDAMSTALYAGTAEDLIQVNWNWIYNYNNGSNGDNFVDLNTLSDVIDLTQFDQAALDQCTIDGKIGRAHV